MSTDNIVVAIKARPLVEKEKNGPQWIIKNNFIYQADGLTDPYTFDHIYNETYTNEAVYNEIVRPLVHSCLSGFNATIFAYGQTSSGKTHTIMGNEKDVGIVSLAISDIFKYIAVDSKRQYLIRCSFFELYNEKLYDLIHLPIRSIRIREDSQGNIIVDADEVVVNSSTELIDVLVQGSKNKKIASTKMNNNSSRSHTIFRIIIESKETNSNNLTVQVSQLNLVDLAGSERLAQTESTGIRLREGVNINKSLLVLGNVIRQLCDNEGYINYRDSKLTRILKASLGGNAKCLVIAAITVAAVEETKSTLEFAQRAKKVENKPTINEITSSETQKQVKITYTNQLKQCRQKISELENELNVLRKKESDVQAVMSFKSNFTIPVTNRRHTICAVKDTYARSTFSCHTPISTDKQCFSRHIEQGRRTLEPISEPEEFTNISISDINIADLNTGQEHNKASYLYEGREKISSPTKYLSRDIEGRRFLEPISEPEEYTSISTASAVDTYQPSIKTCYPLEKNEEKLSSPVESLDHSIQDGMCDIDTEHNASINSTPKSVLRNNLAVLTEDYEDLQQFTTYESMFSENKNNLVLLEKIKRFEEEIIYLKKCEAQRTSFKCQTCQQLQKNIWESKPYTELESINESCDLINENELIKEIDDEFKVSQIKLDTINEQEGNKKRIIDVSDIDHASEKYIEEINAINLILNRTLTEDIYEIIHYIFPQLLLLQDILEKPPTVCTRHVQTNTLQIAHIAVQTQHEENLTNNTLPQTENKQQTEEIVCTKTENELEHLLTTKCNEEIDLMQFDYTVVEEQLQRISTRNSEIQTESDANYVLKHLLQINHIAVQTEYQRISTNSINTPTNNVSIQTESKNQVENITQTETTAYSSVCIQTDNYLEKPPAVQCIQVQTDSLAVIHAEMQTHYQGIPTNNVQIQTDSKNQVENITQTEETAQSSVCIQTGNDLETPPAVQCIQVSTDSLSIIHAAVQTQYQGIPTNNVNIQTDSKNQVDNITQTETTAYSSFCIQTDNDLEKPPAVQCIQVQTDSLTIIHAEVQTHYQGIPTNNVKIQTDSKNQVENITQTEQTAQSSVCVQTDNDLETPPAVQCIQVQTDSLTIIHAEVQTHYQGIPTNNVSIQTDSKNQVENITQTEKAAHSSVCIQTDNDLEKPPAVKCIQVQTDSLSIIHAAVQTQYQGISMTNVNIQTGNKNQVENQTQTIPKAYNSVSVQIENGHARPPMVRKIGVQTDALLMDHIASESRISTDTVQTRLESKIQKRNLTKEAIYTGIIREVKAVEHYVDSTSSSVDVSPLEKRKQKLHNIYDSNRRISFEFTKESMEILQEDMSRYQKEKEEEVSKLKKKLTELEEENIVLNDEVEYFMKENAELMEKLREFETQENLKETHKTIDQQQVSLKGKCVEQKQHCTEYKLILKTDNMETTKQTLEFFSDLPERGQQQIKSLKRQQHRMSEEKKQLEQRLHLLRRQYDELKENCDLVG